MVNYTFNRYCSRKALYKLGMHWFISKIIIMKIPFQIIFISSVFSMRHGNIHWYIFQKNVVFDILNGSIFVADRVQCSGRNLPCEQNVLFKSTRNKSKSWIPIKSFWQPMEQCCKIAYFRKIKPQGKYALDTQEAGIHFLKLLAMNHSNHWKFMPWNCLKEVLLMEHFALKKDVLARKELCDQIFSDRVNDYRWNSPVDIP